MIRLCIVAMALLALTCIGLVGFATQAQPVEGPICYNHGDINADGVIDSRDAVYTLYHYLFGEEEYPVLQDWDFNNDESLDSRDAIYVLCAYNFQNDPNYHLEGVVHNYYEPTWQWDGSAAVATFKCGCGEETVTIDEAHGVVIEEETTKTATCVLAGTVEYIAEVELNGQTYYSSKITTVPARTGGHDMVAGTCTTDSYCKNCDYTVAAPGHKWEAAADLSSAATCTANAVQGFRCSVCDDTKTVTQENTAGHELEYVQDAAKGDCLYVKQYRCTVCTQVFDGEAAADSYYKHTYKATLTKEATCKSEGLKTYVCTECGDSGDTETVPTNDSHAWDNGVTTGDVTTYTCGDCGITKTAVAVTEAVSKEKLGSAQELQLGNDTSMKLDESIVENLDDNREIKISADALSNQEKAEISNLLTEEEKAQIGDNVVYDFNMVYADNDAKVDFDGTITVSLPYTLQTGEDVDSIDVWYIADDGTLERVDGTYSNGFVTFTTDHFSYYTVTRLTAAQRCERYGHIPVNSQKTATCTEDGYTMSECQRCMEVLSKTVHGRTGHSCTTVETPETCTTDGNIVKTCGNCGNTITEIIPALGHDLALDQDKSVAANCTAAGKNTYVCDRDNCDYVREDAVAQLEHDYVQDEPVIADCTNKGIATKTCKDCNDVVVMSETAPLGHSFAPNSAVWSWAEDRSSATVTLYCEHDHAHTKVLTAVITETVVSATCEGDGSVTYSAAASFNNVTYTDEKVTTEDAPGHKPGTAWQSDKNKHYHICSVCEVMVDTAAHNWNDGTVLQEATCGEPGKLLVKCTVCAYEQERVIAATGKHTYVNGVCSVCGHEESSCEHIVMKETELDLSAYNVCAGTDIRIYGCECKQKARLGIYEMGCKFGESEVTEQILPNGDTYEVETYTCTECGLSISGAFYELITEDPCQWQEIEEYTLSVGETEIIHTKYAGYVEEHPAIEKLSETELTMDEYGLCGVKLVESSCPCGEYVYIHESYEETQCDWNYLGYTVEDGINTWRYECGRCGAIKVNQDWRTPTDTSCEVLYTDVYTYYVDGEEVYSYTNTSVWDIHYNELTSYELQGDDCEDGVLMVYTCAECGKVTKRFMGYHETVIETAIDVTDENTCFDVIVQCVCPCGKSAEIYTDGENDCQWGPHVEGVSSICSVCNTVVESTTTTTKDENCNTTSSTTHVYTDKDGKELARVYSLRTEMRHNYEYSYELLGESCEDGVKTIETCKDCGYSYEYTNYGHMTQCVASYDLADYGMCAGTYEIYKCPCGEAYWYNDNFSCNHEGGAGDRYWDETYCSNCSVARRNYYEPIEEIDACHVLRKCGYEFIKDGVVILDGTYERVGEDHDYRYTTSLMPGATDCLGGVYVTASCKNCDHVGNWQTYYHENFTINSTVYGEGVLCGPIEVREYGCACGQYSGTDVYYTGEQSCEFGPNRWSEELNAYVSTCENCGSFYKNTENSTPIEGQSCQYLIDDIYTYYDKDGEELFSYERSWTSTRHNWIYTFQLQGSTCDDGYYVSNYCQGCGEGSTGTWLQYGCNWHDLSRELICQDEEACGSVYLIMDGCACGNLRSFYLDCDCDFRWVGYDEQLQVHLYECQDCGLTYYSDSWNDKEENSCDVVHTKEYHFFRDDEEIASAEGSYTRKEHTWIYSYVLNGETCADGYSWTRTCRYCDATSTGSDSGDHNTRLTAYYDLSDYGMCDGEDAYIAHYSCACGQESYVNSSIDCEWHNTGNKDPDTGATEYYCEECGCYWYYNDKVFVDTETCMESGIYRAWWVKDGETLLSVEAPISRESHTYLMTNAVFDVPGGDCLSGCRVTLTCRYCGATAEEWMSGNHYSYQIQVIDLDAMGACGGEMVLYGCACGKNAYSSFNTIYNIDCHFSYQVENTGNHRNGTSIATRTCADCGLKIVTERVTTTPDGSCSGQNDYTITLTLGDATETMTYRSSHEAHEYFRSGVSFNVEGGNCEDGYTAYMTCAACGDTYSYQASHHTNENIEGIDLSELGACQGTIRTSGCACGEYSDYFFNLGCAMTSENETQGTETSGYNLQTQICTECGLKLEILRTWNIPEDSCQGTDDYVITVTMGDTVRVLELHDKLESHDYVYTYELKPGSVSCTDGLYAYAKCRYCDDGYTTNSDTHAQMKKKSIDLAQYGAVCGGTLDYYVCLCGAEQHYELSEDCACEFDRVDTAMWIENDIDDGQDTAEGWSACWTYAYIYTCAVTDPACGTQIRMATYWLADGCTAKRYETWQLGYDAATGTCLYEITVATGEEQAYHAYSFTEINETQEDGVVVAGGLSACDICGSTYMYKNYYKNGVRIRYEHHAVNTLDNGENKERYYYNEYDYDLGLLYGVDFVTLHRYSWVYADGSEYWYEDSYEYDFTDGCKQIRTYRNSEGAVSVHTETGHRTQWHRDWITESTCTQHGQMMEAYICVVCGHAEDVYYIDIDPYAHDWYWDYEKETYVCFGCGLESVNGASGAIVLEDLTDSLGNGTDYVIGYWDRDNVDFGLYVSLIPEGADGDTEIVLEGIEFTYLTVENDGVRAISCNMEEVAQAAQVSGQTGGYDIRINFVPMSGEHDLDYAITLTNVAAQ